MTHGDAVAVRLVSFAVVVVLKITWLWRLYAARRRHGGSRTATVARRRAPLGGHFREVDRVDFLDFSDHLRYSPPSVLGVQNVIIVVAVLPLLGIVGLFAWMASQGSDGIALLVVVVAGLIVAATLAWLGNRLRLASERTHADEQLQRVGIRRRIDTFRVERVDVINATDVFVVIACWTDAAGKEWETRCGPISGDPTRYFQRHPLVVLQDPERTEDSRVDPTYLPLVNWRGMMDPAL